MTFEFFFSGSVFSQAADRVKINLHHATDPQAKKNFDTLAAISREVVGYGGVFHRHVLGF
jgi:hypothetical protein